jgi:hypothetical protein
MSQDKKDPEATPPGKPDDEAGARTEGKEAAEGAPRRGLRRSRPISVIPEVADVERASEKRRRFFTRPVSGESGAQSASGLRRRWRWFRPSSRSEERPPSELTDTEARAEAARTAAAELRTRLEESARARPRPKLTSPFRVHRTAPLATERPPEPTGPLPEAVDARAESESGAGGASGGAATRATPDATGRAASGSAPAGSPAHGAGASSAAARARPETSPGSGARPRAPSHPPGPEGAGVTWKAPASGAGTPARPGRSGSSAPPAPRPARPGAPGASAEPSAPRAASASAHGAGAEDAAAHAGAERDRRAAPADDAARGDTAEQYPGARAAPADDAARGDTAEQYPGARGASAEDAARGDTAEQYPGARAAPADDAARGDTAEQYPGARGASAEDAAARPAAARGATAEQGSARGATAGPAAARTAERAPRARGPAGLRLWRRPQTELSRPAAWHRHDLLVIVVALVLFGVGVVEQHRLSTPSLRPLDQLGLHIASPAGWLPPRRVGRPAGGLVAHAGARDGREPDAAAPSTAGLPYHIQIQSVLDPTARLEIRIADRPTTGNLRSALVLERVSRHGEALWAADSVDSTIGGRDWVRTAYRYAYKGSKSDAPRIATGIEYATINGRLLYAVTLHGRTDADASHLEALLVPTLSVDANHPAAVGAR